MARKNYKKIITAGLAAVVLSVSALVAARTNAVFKGPDPVTNGRLVWSTDSGKTIRSANADKTGVINMYHDADATIMGDPVWSPDQSKIAFVIAKGAESGIYTINGTGENQTTPVRLTEDTADAVGTDPSWSPDGSKILFARAVNDVSNIFVMDADGSDQTQLTSGYTTAGHQAFDPQWSPVSGSKQIVFTVADGITTPSINSNIHTATMNSGNTAFVSSSDQELPGASWNASDTNSQGQTGNDVIRGEYDAQFSPDGADVIFVRRTPGGSYSIGTVPATGGNDGSYKTVITNTQTGGSVFDPAYSPDGNYVTFEPKAGLLSIGALKVANLTEFNQSGTQADVTVTTFSNAGAEADWTYAAAPEQPPVFEDVSVTCTTEVGKTCTTSIPAYCTNDLETAPLHGASVVVVSDNGTVQGTEAGTVTYTPAYNPDGTWNKDEENYVHVRDNGVSTAKCNVKIIFTDGPVVNIPKTGIVGGLAGLGLAAAIAGTAIYIKEYRSSKSKKVASEK